MRQGVSSQSRCPHFKAVHFRPASGPYREGLEPLLRVEIPTQADSNVLRFVWAREESGADVANLARDHHLYRFGRDAIRLSLARRAILTLPIAYAAWFFAFQVPVLNFWIRITIAAFILLATALAAARKELSIRPTVTAMVVGVISAVLLYLFFWSGYQVLKGSSQFTGTISSVYSLRGAEPVSFIATVLLFPIGPTEEIFWRGFIQNALERKLSTSSSIILTSAIYGSIHVPTLNPSLIFVAFVGGLVWGYIYRRWGLAASIVSHTVWDEMIFVFFVIS